MTRSKSGGRSRVVVGLLVVAVGLLLTLSNLGVFELDEIWSYWPVALILVGISKLVAGQPGRGLLWLAAGAAFLLPVVFEEIEWEDLWDYWPLFLVAIGLRLVVRSFFPGEERREQSDEPEVAETSEPDVEASAFMTSVERRIKGVLRRGDLTAVMGGCDVDLTDAEAAPEGAEIEMFAFWGGVTLRVPDNWEVDPQLTVLMGVIEDNTRQRQASGGRLTVKGMALMGGLEIRN